MSIVGLIVEYNPFHNGHLYHIEESLRLTGADSAIVVMSGNFVQRGVPAIMPKHLRTQMALKSGASLVIELPVRYATGSAEYFAFGAISLLDQLGCVDYLCFGSESGNIQDLSSISKILIDEPPLYSSLLKKHLKSGESYPAARQNAMNEYLLLNHANSELSSVLENPNNILGIEYLKALHKLNSSIIPYTLKRIISHYHDDKLQENCSSASAIRQCILNSPISDYEKQVPIHCYEILNHNINLRYPVVSNDFSLLLHQKLLNATSESLVKFQDINADLANRIINSRNHFIDFDQFCDFIKSKNVTHSRISRACIHILLDIPAFTLDPINTNFYIRILGFKKSDTYILNQIKERSSLSLITKMTSSALSNTQGQVLLKEDIHAGILYESIVTNKFHTQFQHEYSHSIIFD